MKRQRGIGFLLWNLLILAAISLYGCGGGGGGGTTTTTPSTATISVSVSPQTASLEVGKTQQFTATATGGTTNTVTWSVKETGGGTITSAGLYTAPTTAGTYTVVATSGDDTTKTATATVTVVAAGTVSISVSPTTATLAAGATQQFTTTVTGSNTNVTWSATGGTITPTGLYTAPTTAGTYTVTATSAADTTKKASATVTVTAGTVSVSVIPSTATLTPGGTQQFIATVTGSSTTSVTWSVKETGGGTVSTAGYYTAPSTTGTYTVVATSTADPSKTATATVTVKTAASGTVPLTLAEKISVVDSKSSTAKTRFGARRFAPPTFTNGTSVDYYRDRTEVFVEERSVDAFNTVNSILCEMSQARYGDMLNKGDYKAQIDKNQCSNNRDNAKSAGQQSQNQSSGSTAPNYVTWILNSSRADNSSHQIVKAWIREKGEEHDPAKMIFGYVDISEGKSATNPYGLFRMNFTAYPINKDGSIGTTLMFKGYLETVKDSTGKVVFKFIDDANFSINSMGTEKFSEKVVLNRAPDGSGGSGIVFNNFSSPWEGGKKATFKVAFNASNFRRTDAGDSTKDFCLDRVNFDESAWRYGLYDSAGARVKRNSGFPIKYTDMSVTPNKDYFGWVGYWGLWLPDNITINDGATVTKQVFSATGPSTGVDYTLVKKGGKLKKHTKNTTTLDKIKGVPLEGWLELDTTTNPPSYVNYRVKWDGTNFVKFAKMDQTKWVWTNVTEAPIDLSTLNFGELNFWSQSLGGQVRVPLSCTFNNTTFKNSCTAPTNATSIIYFTENIVYPGDTSDPVPATLKCYDNCPKYDATAGVTTYTQDYMPVRTLTGTGHDYTFDQSAAGMLLKEGANALVLTSTGQNQWGLWSGPLFDPNTPNLSTLLKCDWDANQICTWKAWSVLTTYYTWETGPNSWNQLTVLKDSTGAALKFDAPLQVEYSYPTTATGINPTAVDTKYSGTKFYLEYAGFGELHGIPGTCWDMDQGTAVDCGKGGEGMRWVPEFTIPEGSTVTSGGATYYVKPLEKEQRMRKVATSVCDTANLTSPYTTADFPDISLWKDPAIGDMPKVTSSPAVIGGVLQK